MTSLGFNPDQDWIFSLVDGLEGGGEFKAMAGDYSIVMISSGNHRRWIGCASLQIVQGRVGIDSRKFFRIIGRAVF